MPAIEIKSVTISKEEAVMVPHLELHSLRPYDLEFIGANALPGECKGCYVQMKIIAVFEPAQRQFLYGFDLFAATIKADDLY